MDSSDRAAYASSAAGKMLIDATHEAALRDFGATLDDVDLRSIFAYWNQRRAGRSMPGRRDIDVADIEPRLWARLALAEVHPPETPGGLKRYRWRLAGGWWQQIFKMEATGRWMHDAMSDELLEMGQRSYDGIVASRFPTRIRRREVTDGRVLIYEALMAPMYTDDPAQVGMILIAGGPLPEGENSSEAGRYGGA